LWIDVYNRLLASSFPTAIADEPEIALVGFHSSFNLLGVLLVLPFSRKFAVWIERLIPESASAVERALDRALLKEPQAALDAAAQVLRQLLDQLLDCVDDLLELDRPAQKSVCRPFSTTSISPIRVNRGSSG